MEFLNNHFNPLLSAFRSGFGCQMALLRIIEDWKKALDDNKFIAAILMDLSPTQFINDSSFIKFRNRWQDTDRTVITFIKTIILFTM
jgi:hypothetical protein